MKATYPQPDERGTYPAIEYARASIGRSIEERREALKWSLEYVMLKTGITTQRLEAIERGAVTPTANEVEKIERVLRS